MTVLSLFDGVSCGRAALVEAGVRVDKYYASEIDKYAIIGAKHNFPDTIHIGDVTKVSGYDLPKIDLLIGGSPCQGFSFAGKMLNFDDPRSKLFFEYVRILKECREKNPDILFLLENVLMKKESQAVITQYLGVEPVMINSALVSAQNRKRLYWANWEFGQPEDRNIMLADILEDNEPFIKCDRKGNPKKDQDKAGTLTVGGRGCGNHSDMDMLQFKGAAIRGRYKAGGGTEQLLEIRSDNKANSVTTVSKDSMVCVCVGSRSKR